MSAELTVQSGQANLPYVRLTHDCGDSAEIYLHGAHVTSWRTAGSEQLFLSRQSAFAPGKAIRGGVPVIFPQFGAFGPGGRHGFARNLTWSFEQINSTPGSAEFTLTANQETLLAWPFNFAARYTVELTPGRLLMLLQVKNTSEQTFAFTSALHTYFASPDYRQGTLSGLNSLSYWDNGTPWEQRQEQKQDELTITDALDRVYLNASSPLIWQDQARKLKIVADGFKDAVVWNPGMEAAKALADMADDEFQTMICVEAANVAEPIKLEPGASWAGSQQLTLLK